MKFFLKILSLSVLFFTNQSIQGQTSDIKSFMFGHSLMDHRPPLVPTPSNETTIAHWIYLLSQEAGNTYAATGQYGFLPQHHRDASHTPAARVAHKRVETKRCSHGV